MGFFDKLFEKKVCAFCGEDIGLLGNRKLEDGNMCKDCANLLSPWFSDRRESTVAEIQEQLDYREANRAKVEAFGTSRTFGDSTKLLIDDAAGAFMVTSARSYREANPDVISLDDVTGCEFDIEEDSEEIKKEGADGTMVSYDPPRYRYDYDFYLTIYVRNPYFDEIRFRLNGSSIEMEDEVTAERVPKKAFGRRGPQPIRRSMTGAPMPAPRGRSSQSAGFEVRMVVDQPDPEENERYNKYVDMGEEAVAALLRKEQTEA